MKCSRIVDGKICGVELEPNGKFCTECGEDVREAPCPQCQEQLRETQKFCKNCRFKVTDNLFQTKKSTDQKDTTNDDDETKSKSKESEKDRTAKAKNVSESSIDCEKKESVLDANKEVKDSNENYHENCNLSTPSSSEVSASPNDEVESKSQENDTNEALNRENNHENCSLNKPPSSESTAAPNDEVKSKSQENEVNEALNRESQEDTTVNSIPDEVNNENQENREDNGGERSPTKVDNDGHSPTKVDNDGRSPTKVNNGATASDGSKTSEGDQEDTKINSTPDGVNNENEENRGNNDDGRSPTKVDNGAKARDGSEASEDDQTDSEDSSDSSSDSDNNIDDKNANSHPNGNEQNKEKSDSKVNDEDVRIHKYQGENEADSMDDKNEAETKDVNSDGTTYDENVNKENEEKPNSHDNKRGNNRLLQHLEEDKHDNESESINDGENGNSSKAGPNANECSSVDNEHDHEKMEVTTDLEPLAKSMTENGSSEKSSGKSTKKKEQQKKQKNVKASVKNAFKHMTKSSEGKKETNSGKGQKEQNKSNSKNSSKKKDETKQRNTKIVQTDALNKSSTGCHKETKTDRISKENIQPQDPHIEEGKNGKQDKTRPTNEQADGNLDMNEPTCHIYFHPILSPSILRNPGNDRVFVKVELGKKSHKRLELTFKRRVRGNEKCMEYEGLISIQQSNNLSLCYNYCVETKDNKVIEEYVYDNGNKSPIPREFISTKRKDVYHLYDGVIRSNLKDEKEKDSSILSSLKDTISTFVTGGAAMKTLQEDAKLMIRHFLSHFLDSVVNGVELISNVGCLCSGVNRFYFLREKLWSDRKAMDVQISKEMAPIVHETVSELVKRNGKTKEDRLVILEKAISIVLLNETYAGIHIDDQTLENICKVLLPDPIDRDGCVYLLSSMKTKYAADTRIPIDGLKNIMTVSLKQGTFSWLYCLPLLHFLEERYEPYQSIPDDANHRDKVPVWWGIESVNTLLENFKRKRHER